MSRESAELIVAAAGGALFSPAIALAIAFARDVVGRVVSAILRALFVTHFIQGDGTVALQDYLRSQGKLYTSGRSSMWTRILCHIRPEGIERQVFFRAASDSNALMFYRGWPIAYVVPENQSGDRRMGRYVHLRWTVKWDRLLKECQDSASPERARSGVRYRIIRCAGSGICIGNKIDPGRDYAQPVHPSNYPATPGSGTGLDWQPLGYDQGDIGPPNPPDPFRHLAMGSEAARVIRDATFWLKHREWYREREMPWRYGCLLKGPPGTGKTSLVRGVAQNLDLPVIVADLSGMTNYDLTQNLKLEIDINSPCVLLLEDVDNVFHGRDNVIDGSSLSFDALLNFLDGVEGLDGVLTFVTTNRPELLDPALTRPGRLDLHVELPGLDAAGRMRVAMFVLQDQREAEAIASDEREGESPAEFKERCCKRARELLWAA